MSATPWGERRRHDHSASECDPPRYENSKSGSGNSRRFWRNSSEGINGNANKGRRSGQNSMTGSANRGINNQQLKASRDASCAGHSYIWLLNILHTRVTQVVEQLHAVYPQHRRQRIGCSASACLRIERSNAFFKLFPRDQTIHALEEYPSAGLALLTVVFQVPKCRLLYRILHPKHLRMV